MTESEFRNVFSAINVDVYYNELRSHDRIFGACVILALPDYMTSIVVGTTYTLLKPFPALRETTFENAVLDLTGKLRPYHLKEKGYMIASPYWESSEKASTDVIPSWILDMKHNRVNCSSIEEFAVKLSLHMQ